MKFHFLGNQKQQNRKNWAITSMKIGQSGGGWKRSPRNGNGRELNLMKDSGTVKTLGYRERERSFGVKLGYFSLLLFTFLRRLGGTVSGTLA